jgi:hypothetical protein
MPLDRVVANLDKFLKDHPDDAEAHYRLGRAHTMALETKTESVLAFGNEEHARPAEGSWAKRNWGRDKNAPQATPEQLKEHLRQAVEHLNKAISLRPQEARYRLTLACALEAGQSMMDTVDVWPLCPVKPATELDPRQGYIEQSVKDACKSDEALNELLKWLRENSWRESLRDQVTTMAYGRRDDPGCKDRMRQLRDEDWREQIEEQYFTAMTFALPLNGKATEKPIWGGMEDWTSYEAGQNYIRVVTARKPRPTDKIRLAVAKETIAGFDGLSRPNAITPIVIDLHGRGLTDLSRQQTNGFDLDGSHRPQRWSWVTPDAGILVWDPERTSRITSGRQLFGSVTWWVMFDNGYQALDALDDNRDGELTGGELDGIAVWFDRNGDGVSDPGEVVPVYQLGITGISCRATGREGASPVNLAGVRLSDGTRVASYDWIATPVPPPRRGLEEAAAVAGAVALAGGFNLVRRGRCR